MLKRSFVLARDLTAMTTEWPPTVTVMPWIKQMEAAHILMNGILQCSRHEKFAHSLNYNVGTSKFIHPNKKLIEIYSLRPLLRISFIKTQRMVHCSWIFYISHDDFPLLFGTLTLFSGGRKQRMLMYGVIWLSVTLTSLGGEKWALWTGNSNPIFSGLKFISFSCNWNADFMSVGQMRFVNYAQIL